MGHTALSTEACAFEVTISGKSPPGPTGMLTEENGICGMLVVSSDPQDFLCRPNYGMELSLNKTLF